MDLDYHLWRFDWAGGPAGIGSGVSDLAQRAEALGVRTLSVMDHFFQMEAVLPADDPMLEGYTALGYVAGWIESNAKKPVFDETGLPGEYDWSLKVKSFELGELNAGLKKIGLAVTSERRKVDYLVIRRVDEPAKK